MDKNLPHQLRKIAHDLRHLGMTKTSSDDVLFYVAGDQRAHGGHEHSSDDAYNAFVQQFGHEPDYVMAVTEWDDGGYNGEIVWSRDEDDDEDEDITDPSNPLFGVDTAIKNLKHTYDQANDLNDLFNRSPDFDGDR